jgi:hypothetical protein
LKATIWPEIQGAVHCVARSLYSAISERDRTATPADFEDVR